jgi:2'-5' RNA ligase
LFVAVFPPEDVLAELRRGLTTALAAAGRKVRLTPVDRWHLTLAFLGEVEADRLPDVERALAAVAPPGPLRLRLSGGGSFGRARSAVLWAGVDGDLDGLARLHAGLRGALVATGLPHDERPFTPHLTVAYANSAEIRDALRDHAGATWTADEFVLVRSLNAEGGGYRRLRAWPLG